MVENLNGFLYNRVDKPKSCFNMNGFVFKVTTRKISLNQESPDQKDFKKQPKQSNVRGRNVALKVSKERSINDIVVGDNFNYNAFKQTNSKQRKNINHTGIKKKIKINELNESKENLNNSIIIRNIKNKALEGRKIILADDKKLKDDDKKVKGKSKENFNNYENDELERIERVLTNEKLVGEIKEEQKSIEEIKEEPNIEEIKKEQTIIGTIKEKHTPLEECKMVEHTPLEECKMVEQTPIKENKMVEQTPIKHAMDNQARNLLQTPLKQTKIPRAYDVLKFTPKASNISLKRPLTPYIRPTIDQGVIKVPTTFKIPTGTLKPKNLKIPENLKKEDKVKFLLNYLTSDSILSIELFDSINSYKYINPYEELISDCKNDIQDVRNECEEYEMEIKKWTDLKEEVLGANNLKLPTEKNINLTGMENVNNRFCDEECNKKIYHVLNEKKEKIENDVLRLRKRCEKVKDELFERMKSKEKLDPVVLLKAMSRL